MSKFRQLRAATRSLSASDDAAIYVQQAAFREVTAMGTPDRGPGDGPDEDRLSTEPPRVPAPGELGSLAARHGGVHSTTRVRSHADMTMRVLVPATIPVRRMALTTCWRCSTSRTRNLTSASGSPEIV